MSLHSLPVDSQFTPDPSPVATMHARIFQQFGRLVLCLFCLTVKPTVADQLFPVNLADKTGTSTLKPLEVLALQDATGTDDDRDRYVEFVTGSKGYRGIFTFKAPNSDETVTELVFHANYRGLNGTDQRWVFKLLDFQSGKWILVADNRYAPSWEWYTINETITSEPDRFIDAQRHIKVLYKTRTSIDNSLIDLLAIETVTDSTTPSDSRTLPDPTPPESTTLPESTDPPVWWTPTPGASWQIQYTGEPDYSLDVDIYNVDLFDTSVSDIDALRAQGKRIVCYFSAGSYEEWRPDAEDFPSSVKGRNLDGWPGEKWLDIRKLDILLPIMQHRMELAAQKHCHAVDPDNVDGYSNNTGLPLRYDDQRKYNIALAQEAHKQGLAIGLKNDLGQVNDLINYFDFAVNEECFQYIECALLKPFVNANKAVFGIEYQLSPSHFCPQANGMNFDFLKKRLSLNARRVACR